MRLVKFLAIIALCLTVGTTWSAPLDLKGKTLQQTFDELLPNLAKNDAQQKWQDICFQLGAPGNEAQRLEACKLMADKLAPATPNAARIWLLKQLERIGRAECVEAVAAVLDDKDDLVRDAAVRCLANNPAPQATAKLLAKLPTASGKARIGLVNALGQRTDPAALDAVAKELSGTDAAVAIAAARSLGKLGTPEAAKALAAARGKAEGELRLAISDAYIRCADRRLKEGKPTDAAAIYNALNKADEPRPIRLAALRGVLQSAGDQAGPIIVDILAGSDADARAIAVGQIESLSAGALKPLAANLDKLPPASQVLVLSAIAARGDRSLAPAALAAVKSPNEAIKRAGIQALGRLGDATIVPMLLDTLFAANALSGTAGDSLAQLGADGITDKLIAALEAEKTASRFTALVGVLERRRAVTAVPALLNAARGDDAAVRTSAFAGLKTLAEPKHVAEMALALVKTEKGKERDQAELAIVAVCAQIAEPAKRAEPVLAVYVQKKQTELLPLLGRLGEPDVLPHVKTALADSNPAVSALGVTALCNWPEPSVSDELLKLAKDAKEPAQRLQALQAVIRINTVQATDRTNEQKLASLAALKKAMDLATRDEERKALLEGIGFVRHLDTLHYVLPYLDNKDLAQSARKAVVEVAHSRPVREANKAEFDKALDRVIAMCKDKGLVDRARQYKLGQ